MDLALRALNADDEHVLGQPAFRASLITGNSERMAFLAEQCVTAIARPVAHDRELLGEVHDETALGVELADRMKTLDEAPGGFDLFERGRAHTRHEVHVGRDVCAVGYLHAVARVG